MPKLYLFNYRFLPILANSLWKIRNYESINPWNNSIKHFSLNTKEIVLDCYFSRKYVRTIYIYIYIYYKMNSTTIDWNLIKLDTYEKQAEFLNSITVFGKPVMRVTPEYLAKTT